MNPSIGRILIYTLTEQDAEDVNRRRTDSWLIQQATVRTQWSKGAQAHIGNDVKEGDQFPLMVVATLGGENLNGQVFLDGTDTLWVTNILPGNRSGTWHWPVLQVVR
jgi:hypothetical protein